MVSSILPLFPYCLFWKKELKLSFGNIFQIHTPSLLKTPLWLPILLRAEAKILLTAMRPYMIWLPASSCTLFPIILTLSCAHSTQATLDSCWSWSITNTFLSHSIYSYLGLSSSTYLCDFLLHVFDISTEMPPHHRGYCVGQGFPRSKTWDKDLNECHWGETDPKERSQGRKR